METDALLLRATEVAAALGIGRATAYELMASGELPTVRIGRAVRVPRAGLEEWIRQQTTCAEGNGASDGSPDGERSR
jgi:excisionase family DNA binding protein